MVFLGYVLPTNEEDERIIRRISEIEEISIEEVLHRLILKAEKEGI